MYDLKPLISACGSIVTKDLNRRKLRFLAAATICEICKEKCNFGSRTIPRSQNLVTFSISTLSIELS